VEEKQALDDEAIRVQFRIQEGFASAMSAFSLGLLAIPLGLKASRKETTVNVGIAAGLTILYYVLAELIGWLESYPTFRPDLFIWLPNIGLQGLAFVLLLKASKH
jgi:lipopolysaccharide export system permease protein